MNSSSHTFDKPRPGTHMINFDQQKYQQRISPQRTPNPLNKHFSQVQYTTENETQTKWNQEARKSKNQGDYNTTFTITNRNYTTGSIQNCSVCTKSIGCSSITPRHRNFYLNITQYPELKWKERIIIRNFVHQI
jgi:hypothetical protein